MRKTTVKIIDTAKAAIEIEINSLTQLSNSIGKQFSYAVLEILKSSGRVVVVGMGKSGHVARKIAATLSSTGTPALFLHPAEASHGDLGMICNDDLVIAISKSGETIELLDTISYCRRFGIKIIAITANNSSTLACSADHVLLLPDAPEACPLGLAPTASTTSTMALGDAIAIACLQARDFKASEFRDFHPGGKLGQKLTRVEDIMHGPEMLPLVHETASLSDAVIEMSRGRFGCVGIVDEEQILRGIFTDGDLRRAFSGADLNAPIRELMTPDPHSIAPNALIEDVAKLFSDTHIPSVFACLNGRPVGLVHVHDLLQRGFI